jgi:hypothetical protein
MNTNPKGAKRRRTAKVLKVLPRADDRLDSSALCQTSSTSRIAEAKSLLAQLWGLQHPPTRLPCSHPCSIMRADLPTLWQNEYRVGVKTDGVRMFLLMGWMLKDGEEHEYAVLIDRAFRMYDVLLEAPMDYYSGSLFDGEFVVSAEGENVYVAFDIIASNGYDLKASPHSERMSVLSSVFANITVVDPPLRCDVKEWYPLSRGPTLAASGLPSDGFILVAEHGRLHVGMQRDMFKWKEVSHHTIDFLYGEDGALHVSRNGTSEPALLHGIVLASDAAVPAPTERDAVVECSCVRVGDVWHATPRLVRTDKMYPNDVRVVLLTLQNIEEAVGAEELWSAEE